ncbi:unnamed protein product [Trichobilharzia regenti]|nr:unnamed protein product [Trichobilharzia regenti]
MQSSILSTATNHIHLNNSSSTAPSSPVGGVQSIRKKYNSIAHSSPPPLQPQSGHNVTHQNSKDGQFQQSPAQSPIPSDKMSSPSMNNANVLREKTRTNGTTNLQSDVNGQTVKYSTQENSRIRSEVRKPRLDGLKTVDTLTSGSPVLTSSSSSTANSPILSHAALSNAPPTSSPRFHRKKSSLIHTTDQLSETPPSSPNSFSQSQWRNSGRSSGLEPSPLLTHKSWFNGFLTAASGHVITKGSQHAANAAAAAQDSAALAISIQSKCKEENEKIKEENEQSELHHEKDTNSDKLSEQISTSSELTESWKNSSIIFDGSNNSNNRTNTNTNVTESQYSTSQPSSPSYSTVSDGVVKSHHHYHHTHHYPHHSQLQHQSHHMGATTDTQFISSQLHSSDFTSTVKQIERRGFKPFTSPLTNTVTSTNNNNESSSGTSGGGGNAPPEETNHVVMVKGRALNRLKAELVQVFLATPGVVHTVISPTSFRAEYRRAGSGSSLLARPVKLQVDMVRATGGISTGSGHQNNINSISSEREVYAVNFQLLSGPTRRFKRLCDQLQTALLSGAANPSFVAHSTLSSVGGTTSITSVSPTSNIVTTTVSSLTSSSASLTSTTKGHNHSLDEQQNSGQTTSDLHFNQNQINQPLQSRSSEDESVSFSKFTNLDEISFQKNIKV